MYCGSDKIYTFPRLWSDFPSTPLMTSNFVPRELAQALLEPLLYPRHAQPADHLHRKVDRPVSLPLPLGALYQGDGAGLCCSMGKTPRHTIVLFDLGQREHPQGQIIDAPCHPWFTSSGRVGPYLNSPASGSLVMPAADALKHRLLATAAPAPDHSRATLLGTSRLYSSREENRTARVGPDPCNEVSRTSRVGGMLCAAAPLRSGR